MRVFGRFKLNLRLFIWLSVIGFLVITVGSWVRDTFFKWHYIAGNRHEITMANVDISLPVGGDLVVGWPHWVFGIGPTDTGIFTWPPNPWIRTKGASRAIKTRIPPERVSLSLRVPGVTMGEGIYVSYQASEGPTFERRWYCDLMTDTSSRQKTLKPPLQQGLGVDSNIHWFRPSWFAHSGLESDRVMYGFDYVYAVKTGTPLLIRKSDYRHIKRGYQYDVAQPVNDKLVIVTSFSDSDVVAGKWTELMTAFGGLVKTSLSDTKPFDCKDFSNSRSRKFSGKRF